ILGSAAANRVEYAAAVNSQSGERRVGAAYRHIEKVVLRPGVLGRHADAWLEQCELKEVPPVEWKRIDLLATHDTIDLIICFVYDRSFADNVHDDVGRTYSQACISVAGISYLHGYNLIDGRKSAGFNLDVIVAR